MNMASNSFLVIRLLCLFVFGCHSIHLQANIVPRETRPLLEHSGVMASQRWNPEEVAWLPILDAFQNYSLSAAQNLLIRPRRVKRSPTRLTLAYSACGPVYCEQFINSAKTAVAQLVLDRAQGKNMSYDMLVVSDNACAQMIDKRLRFPEHIAKLKLFDLTVIPIERILNLPDSSIDLFKHCAAVRLYLPRLLHPKIDRFLYIDSDALVASSLMPVTVRMEKEPAKVLFMAPEAIKSETCNPCGWYSEGRNDVFVRKGTNGFNTGVTAINVKNWMANSWDKHVQNCLQLARENKLHLILGDQDVLNYIVKQDPSSNFEMPAEFNVRMDTSSCGQKPMFLHLSHGSFLAKQWKDMAFKLLKAADRVLATGPQPGGGEHLWDEAGVAHAMRPFCKFKQSLPVFQETTCDKHCRADS